MEIIFKIKKPKEYKTYNDIFPTTHTGEMVKSTKFITETRNLTKWNDENGLCCWFCTRKITSEPIGLPYRYVDGKYSVKGSFCGFKCANSYNLTNESDNKWIQESYLNELYVKYGNTLPIGTALPKEILIKYGGIYTDAEYEQLLNKGNVAIIQFPPIYTPIYTIGVSEVKFDNKKYRFSRHNKLQF